MPFAPEIIDATRLFQAGKWIWPTVARIPILWEADRARCERMVERLVTAGLAVVSQVAAIDNPDKERPKVIRESIFIGVHNRK